jgi:translation elongation factor P/translation initiation factor 5A
MANSEPSKSLRVERSTTTFAYVEPVDAGQIKCGCFVLLSEGHPCKVVEAKFAVNGKHGTSKAIFVGIDIFTRRKYTWGGPSNTLMYMFKPERKEYTLVDVSKDLDVAQYLDDKESLQNICIPIDLGKHLTETLANDEASSVEIKIVRAPTIGTSDTEFDCLQAVESFRLTTTTA